MSLVRFDPSIVTVKQSFIVSQIVSCPVVLSSFVSLDSVVFTLPVTVDFDSENDFAKVVETSVTVNNNSPIQDYVHPDDHTQPTLL